MIEGIVARGRASRALHCTDAVRVVRRVRGQINPTTARYDVADTEIYVGAARVKRASSVDQVAGDAERQAVRPELVLPYGADGATAIRVGDLVTVTASLNAALVGATMTVAGAERGTTETAHVFVVEEVVPHG